MGTIEILQHATRMKQQSNGPKPRYALKSSLTELQKHSTPRPWTSLLQAPEFTRVQISSQMGFSAQGLLRSISRGGIQVSTPIPVPTRCPLQITIVGCRPIAGEAVYSMKRAPAHRVGIAFTTRHRPILEKGAMASIRCLAPPFAVGRASILELRGSSVSLFGKVAVASGSWVRIEASSGILFGVVKDVIPTGMTGRYLEIYLEAAFPCESAGRTAATEPVSIRSHSEAHTVTPSDGVAAQEGAERSAGL